MSRAFLAVALLSTAVVPVGAQQAAAPTSLSAVQRWSEAMAGNILKSAEQMPEEKFSYRPTAEVRSFGEIVGHTAGAQNMICAVALGEQPPAEDAVEKSATTKAGLIEALKASIAYCGRAYAMSDADSQQPVQMFGQETTRFGALVLNAVHNGEHYGNLVTYLRINGMVPPSSQRGM
jgi:uncharacterized damage-inducible protein DinB